MIEDQALYFLAGLLTGFLGLGFPLFVYWGVPWMLTHEIRIVEVKR